MFGIYLRPSHVFKIYLSMILAHALLITTSINAHSQLHDELHTACEPHVEPIKDQLPTCKCGTDPEQEMKYIMQPVLSIGEKTTIEGYAKAYADCETRLIGYAQGCLGYPMDLVECKTLFEEAKSFVHKRYPKAPLDVFDRALEWIKADQAIRFQ